MTRYLLWTFIGVYPADQIPNHPRPSVRTVVIEKHGVASYYETEIVPASGISETVAASNDMGTATEAHFDAVENALENHGVWS